MPKHGVVEVLVRSIPGGLMSTCPAGKAAAGDALTITGPIGPFYLREVKRPALFLAGGTGLAPVLALLEKLQSSGSPQPVRMIFGVTNDAAVATSLASTGARGRHHPLLVPSRGRRELGIKTTFALQPSKR